MKNIVNLILITTLFASAHAFAEQITSGLWLQTSSTAGECSSCTIDIEKPTSHIIEISANNGWIGYAYYNENMDIYTGAMEWKAGNTNEHYDNKVFLIKLTLDGHTLTMRTNNNGLGFSTTYRKE